MRRLARCDGETATTTRPQTALGDAFLRSAPIPRYAGRQAAGRCGPVRGVHRDSSEAPRRAAQSPRFGMPLVILSSPSPEPGQGTGALVPAADAAVFGSPALAGTPSGAGRPVRRPFLAASCRPTARSCGPDAAAILGRHGPALARCCPARSHSSRWVLAAWGSRETWAAGRVRVVTGRRCWRQVCCPCAGAMTGSRVPDGGRAVQPGLAGIRG